MSRPKRIVLVVGQSETDISCRKFQLETRGFHVIPVSSAESAMEIFRLHPVDLVLVEIGRDPHFWDDLVRGVKMHSSRTMVLFASASLASGSFAHDVDGFCGRGTPPSELIDRIKIMTSRKRGPRPIPMRPELLQRTA